MASGLLLQRPPSQVARRSARIQTAKPRQVPRKKPEAGFTASLLRKREMAGTDCRLKRRLCRNRKRIAAWKTFFFSYCRAASVRWWRASRSCCDNCWACPDVRWACPDVPGEPGSSTTRGNRYRLPFFEVIHKGRSRALRGLSRNSNKKPGLATGLLSQSVKPFQAASSATAASSPSASTSASSVSPSASVASALAARALGELALDFLDRLGLRRMLDNSDFARHWRRRVTPATYQSFEPFPRLLAPV